MRFHRYALAGAVDPFLELCPNGPLALGEQEAASFNDLDAATREAVYDVTLDGPAIVCARIREVIA